MTDIVERLRGFAEANRDDGFNAWAAVEEDAADEIERLRADNARLRAALREIVDREADASGGARLSDFHDIRCACGRCAADIARAALDEKDG